MKPALTLVLLFLAAPIPSFAETYDKWVAGSRSYKDVAQWLGGTYRFLPGGNGERRPVSPEKKPLRTRRAQEIFRAPAGGPLEASLFAKEALNRIDPDYRAEIISLSFGRSGRHYSCGFFLGGRLFVMDFGNPDERKVGTHGPFADLDEYVRRFYPGNGPGGILSYHFVRPPANAGKPPAPSPHPPIFTVP